MAHRRHTGFVRFLAVGALGVLGCAGSGDRVSTPSERIALTAAAWSTVDAGPPPIPTINAFVLYAERSINIGDGANVWGGSIGVHATSPTTSVAQVSVGGYAVVEGSQSVFAPTVSLAINSSVGILQTNAILQNENGHYQTLTSYPAFAMPPMPLAPAANTSGPTITVAAGASQTLSPGNYGDLSVQTHGQLLLSPGAYSFSNIALAEYGHLVAQSGGVDVLVAGSLNVARYSTVEPYCCTGLSASDLTIEVSGSDQSGVPTATILPHSTIQALLLVPNGTLSLGNTVVAKGAFFGFDVVVGQHADLNFQSGFRATSTAPPWSAAAVAYSVNDLVSFDGMVYEAIREHTSAAALTPPLQPTLWTVVDKLNFSTSTPPSWFGTGVRYEIGDIVSVNGPIYIAIQPHTSTPLLTPANSPTFWRPYFPLVEGVLGGTCLSPSTREPIAHCADGLGCDWGTSTCAACGAIGQPCCDGPDTPFAGVCVVNPLNPAIGCGVCSAGACNDATHVCQGCGSTIGAACCPPDESDVFATCKGSGIFCNWSDDARTVGTCASCGATAQPACPDGTCQSGLQVLADNTCSGPPTLNLATLNVAGPITLQGNMPWTDCKIDTGISNGSGSGDILQSCPPDLPTSPMPTPRWVQGSGFTVTDGTEGGTQTPPVPKLYVPSPNLTLGATVSFTDDTSKVAFPWSSYVNGVLVTTCTQTMWPGMVEGNHAHYSVRIEHWVDNAPSCPAAQPALDTDDLPVRFDGPSPDAFLGCWVDLTSSETDLYGSSFGAPTATVAPQDGAVTATLSIPVNLPAVSNYVRYVVTTSEGDTRVPASVNGTGWSVPPNPLYGTPADDCNGPECSIFSGPLCTGFGFNLLIAHPFPNHSQFSHSQALNAFQLVVQPLALAQLKVMPYTLLYAPPGNASKATYQATDSYGVNFGSDNRLANNATYTIDNKDANTASVAAKGSATGDVVGTVGIGASWDNSMSWDKNTKTGVGTISDVAMSQMTTFTMMQIVSLGPNPLLTPGADETRSAEPFWGDKFYLLVHPQFGLWQLGGSPVVSMLGALGEPGSPSFATASVADLDACAKKEGLYVSGYPLSDTSDVLTSSECAELLTLDPLYAFGQGFPGVKSNPRFLGAPSYPYGTDPLCGPAKPSACTPLDVMITDTLTSINTSMVQTVGSYTATVTDVLTSGYSIGADLSLFGITTADTFTSTETMTSATDWTLTLQSSLTATAQTSWSITGALGDHRGPVVPPVLPYYAEADVYRDSVFGAFLFVDPTAP